MATCNVLRLLLRQVFLKSFLTVNPQLRKIQLIQGGEEKNHLKLGLKLRHKSESTLTYTYVSGGVTIPQDLSSLFLTKQRFVLVPLLYSKWLRHRLTISLFLSVSTFWFLYEQIHFKIPRF